MPGAMSDELYDAGIIGMWNCRWALEQIRLLLSPTARFKLMKAVRVCLLSSVTESW